MVHPDAQHTSLLTYEKMEESERTSDSKDKVAAVDVDRRLHLDVAYSLEASLEKSILNNSRKCLENTEI
jgi:hypothetical protein